MKNKLWATLFMVLVSSISLATESEIHIEQTGDALTLTITQQNGALNKINSSTNPAIIHGDNNNITIMQDGAVNTMTFALKGNQNVVDLKQEGNTNTMDLSCNKNGETSCSDNNIKFYNLGDNNTTNMTITKSNVTLNAILNGDTNTTNITMNSQGGTFNLTMLGNQNDMTFLQTGSPVVPHTATVDHTGNLGTFTYTQTGNIQKIMNVTTYGHNHTSTITQSD